MGKGERFVVKPSVNLRVYMDEPRGVRTRIDWRLRLCGQVVFPEKLAPVLTVQYFVFLDQTT